MESSPDNSRLSTPKANSGLRPATPMFGARRHAIARETAPRSAASRHSGSAGAPTYSRSAR
jgi:hypothetical protein